MATLHNPGFGAASGSLECKHQPVASILSFMVFSCIPMSGWLLCASECPVIQSRIELSIVSSISVDTVVGTWKSTGGGDMRHYYEFKRGLK